MGNVFAGLFLAVFFLFITGFDNMPQDQNIGEADIIQRILKHLGLWETRNHAPPGETAVQTTELIYDDQFAQIPFDDHWLQ